MKRLFLFLILLSSIFLFSNILTQEKNAVYYNDAGWDYLKKEEYLKASAQFIIALNKNPSYLDAKLGLAKCRLKLSAFKEAYEMYDKILQREGDNEEAMIGVAEALSGLGKNDRSLEKFQAVIDKYPENTDAHFGMANIYYNMNKKIWALRKLDTVYKLNPFNYNALLLHSEIKSDDKRLSEAEDLIKKAIKSDPENPAGYTAYAKLYIKTFNKTGKDSYLADAEEEISKALSIKTDYLPALILSGYLYLSQKNYSAAAEAFSKASQLSPSDSSIYYSSAYSSELEGNTDSAFNLYNKAYSVNSDDDINQNALESLLVANNFEIGNPVRTDLSKMYYGLSKESFKKNLAGVGELFLRKSLMMNPMNREAREDLRDYYQAVGYDRFYIEEIKSLQKLFPNSKYREELNLAVIKRRNSMYYNAGYGSEAPERNVPKVLILNLFAEGDFVRHPGGGGIVSDSLSFAAAQFGRMDAGNISWRRTLVNSSDVYNFSMIDEYVDYIISKSGDAENTEVIDFIVYGSYRDVLGGIELNLKIMDIKTGVVIADFSISDSGKNYLSKISYRAAKKLYESIPYKGKILDSPEDGAVVNLGSFDGLKKDDMLFFYHDTETVAKGKYKLRKKILLKIKEADTDICKAEALTPADKDKMRAGLDVFPLNIKRAERIE